MKNVRHEDAALLESVRRMPCAACGRPPPSDPHHVRTVKNRGPDHPDNVAPLCHPHHMMWHKSGPEALCYQYPAFKKWLENHGWYLEELRGVWRHPVLSR